MESKPTKHGTREGGFSCLANSVFVVKPFVSSNYIKSLINILINICSTRIKNCFQQSLELFFLSQVQQTLKFIRQLASVIKSFIIRRHSII